MARINKIRYAGWVCLVFAAIWLGGCTASMQARSAFEEAEQYAAEENYDQAILSYAEAVKLEPGSKTYKLKMIFAQTRAAASHIRLARTLRDEGKLDEALAEYQLAIDYDASIEIATLEKKEVEAIINAEKFAEEGASFYGMRKLRLARKAIDKALELDANNARALAIDDLLTKDQHTIDMDGIELDVASDEPITLSFKDANVKEVFEILSQLSGINFIFDEGIRTQSISVLLEKASFAQAMELIMQMNGLDKKVLNSKTVIIYPQSREKSKQYDDQLIQTFYLSHIDAKKAVNLLRTMLQLRKIYVHEERNAIVVRDKPEVVRLAEKILQAADRSDSEVLFDVEVLAVRDSDELDFGPELSTYATNVGFANDDTALNAIPDTTITQSLSGLQTFYTVPSATFHYAKTLNTTELLASPKIRVKNNEKAKVHIGKRDPIVTTTNIGTSDQTTQNVQYVDSGIKLDIEPKVQLDGTVLAKIKLEVSTAERLPTAPGQSVGESPVAITTTNAETSLVLLDGVRTILGGLYESNSNDNKKTIPFLGDIPLVGSLFTSYDNSDSKREIILSITPYIIKKVELPENDIATIWSGGEDDLKAGPNFGAFAQPLLSEVEGVKPQAAPAVKPAKAEQPEVVEDIAAQLEVASPEAATEPPVAVASEEVAQTQQESITESSAELEIPVAEEKIQAEETVVIEEEAEETAATEPVVEIVPEKVVPEPQETEPPIVLEMPKKGPATIFFDGPLQVEPGNEFTVTVQIADAENLYSAPLFVNYDPSLLELVSINEGSFLKKDRQNTVFSSSPNRTTGQVIVGYKQSAGGKGASGSGDLFSMNFKPIAQGETRLEINRINFRNPDGVRLEVVPETVMIQIR